LAGFQNIQENTDRVSSRIFPKYGFDGSSMETNVLVWFSHGESDFIASTKRFLNIASANRNCRGDNFTCYGYNCNCCGDN